MWLSATKGLGASYRWGDAPLATRWTAVGLRLFVRESDRKSTRLNARHSEISYAVFCLKKKKGVNEMSSNSSLLSFSISASIPDSVKRSARSSAL